MLTTAEKQRLRELARQARELQGELRPLLARERRGELEFTEDPRRLLT
jgi:hypothetical protein